MMDPKFSEDNKMKIPFLFCQIYPGNKPVTWSDSCKAHFWAMWNLSAQKRVIIFSFVFVYHWQCLLMPRVYDCFPEGPDLYLNLCLINPKFNK